MFWFKFDFPLIKIANAEKNYKGYIKRKVFLIPCILGILKSKIRSFSTLITFNTDLFFMKIS